MKKTFSLHTGFIAFAFALICTTSFGADTFRIATYNVENYLDQPTESRHFTKSADARAKIRESIKAMNPDVISFEEMGTTNALLELRASLKADGVDYPYWEEVQGWDTNIHIAVLSKFPIIARRPQTNDTFLLSGRQFHVSRGFLDVDIQFRTNYMFTLLGAHLKSQRPVPEADEAELRLEEAKLLREKVDALLNANPDANIVVLGDFNQGPASPSTKAVIGRGKFKLVDTRPAERNGDSLPNPNPRYAPRNIVWTHYYGAEDSYSRLDYILLSPAMAREWVKSETYIPTIPNWGIGSDHRPIVATFTTENK
jgi:endonuclease/exonuclease/phosphatase family metal-dependent hydrolase